MKVNVKNLKENLPKLNSLLEEYEKNYLNLYNELLTSSLYWKDNNATKFFDAVRREKLNVENTLEELKKIKDIYKYIIENYSTIGEKIEFNLQAQDRMYYQLNNYINKLDNTIRYINSIDLSFCYGTREREKIIYLKERIITIKDKLIQSRENIKNIMDKINKLEIEIGSKLSKINISILKEDLVNDFV